MRCFVANFDFRRFLAWAKSRYTTKAVLDYAASNVLYGTLFIEKGTSGRVGVWGSKYSNDQNIG